MRKPKLQKVLPKRTAKDSAVPVSEETPEEAQQDRQPAEGRDKGLASVSGKRIVAKTSAGLKTASQKARRSTSAIGESAKGVSSNTAQTVRASARRATSASRYALDKATEKALGLVGSTQALLASNLSNDLNQLMQDAVDGAPTIYDQAMDAAYIATHQGGAQHRLFDGGHTIAGAVSANHSASADDSIIQEAFGTVQGLLRDGTTPMGLPIVTWNEATFDRVAETLQSHLEIPKSWFYDLNTFDATELLGGTVGTIALALHWNRADTEDFARLAGGLGLSSVAAANPALLVVAVVALAKAFHKARQTGDYEAFIDGQAKGLVGTGSTLAAVSLVGVAGGPAGVALLAGLTAGVLANRASKNVSVIQLSAVVAKNAQVAAREVKGAASRGMSRSGTGISATAPER